MTGTGDTSENKTTIPDDRRVALVTGGSSGIGAAAARALAEDGWHVVVAARRIHRIEEVAKEIGGTPLPLDVTSQDSVDALVAQLPRLDLLVNNAGGAKGLESVAEARIEDWQWMYDTNVLGTVRVTKALLPLLRNADGGAGLVINIGSIAGWQPYSGGAGYNAAKFGVRALSRVLRIEHADQPIRVTEIDPGRVETDFSLVRFEGDEQKAAEVYADKLNLSAEDVAESIRWVASLPAHMNIDTINIMPRDQV